MIQIERVDRIPSAQWTKTSYREFVAGDPKVVERLSQYIWVMTDDGDVLACGGLIYSSFATEPWFWLLMTPRFALHSLRNIRYLWNNVENLGPVRALVDTAFQRGHKFARAFGFEPTGVVQGYDKRSFEVFRRG